MSNDVSLSEINTELPGGVERCCFNHSINFELPFDYRKVLNHFECFRFSDVSLQTLCKNLFVLDID